jgi:hypothetical protein
MFGPVLNTEGEERMVYATSNGFRIIFFGSAVLLFAIIVGEVDGAVFVRDNFLALSLCLICLIASMYLERWIFDKETNLFERHVGFIFFYSRKQNPLNSLKRISLDEFPRGISQTRGKRGGLLVGRKAASLAIETEDNAIHKLDMAKGSGIKELRKTAQTLSDFCAIPLEDHVQQEEEEEFQEKEE